MSKICPKCIHRSANVIKDMLPLSGNIEVFKCGRISSIIGKQSYEDVEMSLGGTVCGTDAVRLP